jgi:hypothetical protein
MRFLLDFLSVVWYITSKKEGDENGCNRVDDFSNGTIAYRKQKL